MTTLRKAALEAETHRKCDGNHAATTSCHDIDCWQGKDNPLIAALVKRLGTGPQEPVGIIEGIYPPDVPNCARHAVWFQDVPEIGSYLYAAPQAPKLEAEPQSTTYWEEEARRYALNADYWRNRAEKLEAEHQEPVARVVSEASEWISQGDGTWIGGRIESQLPLNEMTLLYATPQADRDALRYQWLKDAANKTWDELSGAQMCGALDAAIDAAMTAEKGATK